MFDILSVFLLTCFYYAAKPTLVLSIDTNELNAEHHNQIKFPTIDPNIVEDAKLTTPQLITKYGYKAEVHSVTTDDGYILEMHRIAGGRKYPPKKGKKVCFLQHGLLDSSATWILSGPNHALGYFLADMNYDIWMGNDRGNRYSLNHTTYDPFGSHSDRRHYWSFSWHEIGTIDLPTMIDYVLATTGQLQLQYIAHSQGTTAAFVMTSERPEYNDKIQMMHALAPIAYLSHVISPPIRVIVPFISIAERVASFLGINYITPSNEYLALAGRAMCRDKAPTQIVCENLLFLMMGYTSDQLNTTLLPVILGHTPAGSATDQLLHYGQEVNSGHFRQFDHGRIGNFIRYKRFSPPDYNVKNIIMPVAIYYAQNDWLADVKDTRRLMNELPNVSNEYLVPHKQFNHIDFLWGIDAPTLLFNEIVRIMKVTEFQMNIDVRNIV